MQTKAAHVNHALPGYSVYSEISFNRFPHFFRFVRLSLEAAEIPHSVYAVGDFCVLKKASQSSRRARRETIPIRFFHGHAV
jgi:hypothetical protein